MDNRPDEDPERPLTLREKVIGSLGVVAVIGVSIVAVIAALHWFFG